MNPWKRKEVIGDATHPVVAIYALCDSDESVRYVGKTIQYLHQRHKAHIRDAKRGGMRPVNRWLRREIDAGNGLTIKLLEYAGADWSERESFWIAKYRADGADLLNLTDGGEGLHGHKFTQVHRDRIAEALRTGATFWCEWCGASFWRKLREIKKGHNRFCSRPCYFEWQRGKPKKNERGLMGVAGRAAALLAKRRRRDCAS